MLNLRLWETLRWSCDKTRELYSQRSGVGSSDHTAQHWEVVEGRKDSTRMYVLWGPVDIDVLCGPHPGIPHPSGELWDQM